jgi:hypothetical protein
MWYVVQGTEYVVRGTRCKTLYMIIQQNELVPEICLYKVEGAELEVQSTRTRYEVRDTG